MKVDKMNLINKRVFLKIIAVTLFAGASFTASASLAKPESGKEYQVLAQPQPTDTQGKVEVSEFFFYTCPHCNVLDPYISAWVKKQGNAISFKRIPVDFGQGQAVLTKLYYTLEAMGQLETLHAKIFEAIHTKRRPLNTEQQVLNFVKENGVDEKKFLEMSTSFAVATKIRRAAALQAAYKIDSVPVIFVDGRYMTSPALVMGANSKMSEAESAQGLMQVLDALVLKAEKDHKSASVPKEEKEQKLKK